MLILTESCGEADFDAKGRRCRPRHAVPDPALRQQAVAARRPSKDMCHHSTTCNVSNAAGKTVPSTKRSGTVYAALLEMSFMMIAAYDFPDN